MRKIISILLCCCLILSLSNTVIFADSIAGNEISEHYEAQQSQVSDVITYVTVSESYVKEGNPVNIVIGLSEEHCVEATELILVNNDLQKEYFICGNITEEGNVYFESFDLKKGCYFIKGFKYIENDIEWYINFEQIGITAKFGVDMEVDNIEADAYIENNCDYEAISSGNEQSIENAIEKASQEINFNNLYKASSKIIVVLDPGHGGYQSGATKCYNGKNYIEKDLNLTIAKYCKEELEKYTNVEVYMTRDKDEYVGLDERVEKAKNVGATVFVSIHNNSNDSSSLHGATVYYPNSNLNSDVGLHGKQLAEDILEQLVALGLSNNGARIRNSESGDTYSDGSLCDYYSVIRNSKKAGFPGIIVEHAFISNSNDALNYLGSEDKLKRLGVADAQGIINYYGLKKEVPGTIYNGIDYTSIFDATFYMNKYPDVKACVNGDPQRALVHFMEHGIDEGRQGRAEFDVNFYKNKYSDLQNAFGNNWGAYYNHFFNYGINEGRQSGENVDVLSYKFRYTDLQNIYENNYKLYYMHYIQHGKSEGRDISPIKYNVVFVNEGNIVKSEVVNYGRSAKAPELSRTGYNLEWDKSYSNICSDVTITAKWSLANYIITYNANGGETAKKSKTVTYNGVYGDLEVPTREGYTFTGWYTLSNGGSLITKDSKVDIGCDHTLYAHWTANNYTVELNANGGTVSMIDKVVVFGQSYGELPIPIRVGYDFDGWWTELDSGKRIEASTLVENGNNHILYAHWKLKSVSVNYQTHVQNVGWQNLVNDGSVSGTTGKSLRLEGIKINLDTTEDLGVIYTTHVQNDGWHNNSFNGELSGTTGQSKRLEAIMIKLEGSDSSNYDIYYRVHAQAFGWLAWAKNGEPAGTSGYKYRLEAIQILIVEKGDSAPSVQYGGFLSQNQNAYISTNNGIPMIKTDTNINYSTHVQNVGWQEAASNGLLSGTTGMGLNIEGIKIKLDNQSCSGYVNYAAHVQNIGWQSSVDNGQIAGTTGKSLRMEAIKISLNGEINNKYDIYYRVHVQNYGWLGWAKNGEIAGTEGLKLGMESIQIVLIKKGDSEPAYDYGSIVSYYSEAFYTKKR